MASGYRPHIDALDGMDREPCLSLFILNPPRTPMNTLHPSGAPVFFEDPPETSRRSPAALPEIRTYAISLPATTDAHRHDLGLLPVG
jgi:hypothetical protein